MKTLSILFLLIIIGLSRTMEAQENQAPNPFFIEWNTPFNTPPYNLIKDEHYKLAFEKGMELHSKEIEAILNTKDITFENTLEALEKSGELLSKVSSIFFSLNQSNTNSELQKLAVEVSPLLSKHYDDINLNPVLFERIKYIYDNINQYDLNSEQKYLVEKYYIDFKRRGALLNETQKEDFRKINQEMSLLSLRFRENLLKETNSFELLIEDRKDLAGIPDGAVEMAAIDAKRKGYDGKWLFTLQAPSYRAFITYADNRDLREKIFKANLMKCDNNNEFDNKKILADIVKLRLKRANLLGYKSHSHFVLDRYMAKDPGTVYSFLMQIWEPAIEKATEEAKLLQDYINKDGKDFKLQPWDWSYYAEKVKKELYDIDEETLKPYFKLENVLDGMFEFVNILYGIKLEERKDIYVYHPDVKCYEVKDKNNKHIGIVYFDFFPRESKRSGAWASSFRVQSNIQNNYITPIVYNTKNLTKPTENKPSLLSFLEVETMFHEFGHALHMLFSDVTYPSFSGTSVAWDFVELPSQIMENWLTEPQVLKMFARHYETGEVIPDELIEKLVKSSKFNQGFATTSYLTAALLDMDYHTIEKEQEINSDVFENNLVKRIGVLNEIGVRYRSTFFQHIFAGGYSSGYYSYIWAEVLDTDAFEYFKEKGIFNQELAESFRRNVLSKGGSEDPMNLYVNFRGKKPGIESLLKKRGLK